MRHAGVQGVPEGETRVTCTACAGTLLLEFGLLSRLTEDPEYEEKARNAAVQVYSEPRACHMQGYLYRSKINDRGTFLQDLGVVKASDLYPPNAYLCHDLEQSPTLPYIARQAVMLLSAVCERRAHTTSF